MQHGIARGNDALVAEATDRVVQRRGHVVERVDLP
ncbi:Uncharacterised protein [Mycobacteroides abscessus subsp. abscessus]|nr:Uncharacterised protein [Mycobacteroides abscessus subsp. abscessus]